MNLLLDKQEFDNLEQDEKKARLAKYLHTQHGISKLNEDDELQKQFSLLLKLQPDLLTRFGKFIVVNVTEKKIEGCCDDIKSALEVTYGLGSKKESFIYQLPETV